MSFVDTYQVGSLRWRRDLPEDGDEEIPPAFVRLNDSVGQSSPQLGMAQSSPLSEGSRLEVDLTQAVLAVCLNLGNSSQDKSRMEEAFFDPSTRHHERAMRKVMSNLAAQLNLIQDMTVLALPDPRQETVISALQRARRASPFDQILFLYNDHGTLAPTSQGEIWVYDTDFPVTPTTYNPVFVSSLLDAAQAGTVYIWDCDNAGRVIDCAVEHGKRRDVEYRQKSAHLPEGIPSQLTHAAYDVHFGSCATDQLLPVVDNLPRDVFTTCMMMPLAMALRYHALMDTLRLGPLGAKSKAGGMSFEMCALDSIPGHVEDRNSPLGDLNWLFVNIIDTIAWQSLSPEAFRTLFRTSHVLRTLSRGYILAQRVLRDFDCTPVSYPDIPSMHLHPMWQVWDTALEDFLCQLPIAIPVKGDPYCYRSPILLKELLQSIAAQLSLFANANMNEVDRKSASKLCANSLPIVFSACEGGRYRSWAFNLLAKYLDIGGYAPVEWIIRCGVFEILPAILEWSSTHEASVAIFLLQRLMLSVDGPLSLIRPHKTLHKPPLDLLGDFLCQHISYDSFNLPADIVAGILYLYTRTIQAAKWEPPDAVRSQWKQVTAVALHAVDSFVRSWAILALAAGASPDFKQQEKVRSLALCDTAQNVRIAASFAIWHWWPKDDCGSDSCPMTAEECDLVNFISLASEDASYYVRTSALALAMELATSHHDDILKRIKQHAVPSRSEEIGLSQEPYGPLITTLVKGCSDPLIFLRKATKSFLQEMYTNQGICDAANWSRVFPDIPASGASKDIPEQPLASTKQLLAKSDDISRGKDGANPEQERPLMKQILGWRNAQECYFHETRLTWSDNKTEKLKTDVSKNRFQGVHIMACDVGSRIASSWTKDTLEIQTTAAAQLLCFHPHIPVLAYDCSKGYRLFDYDNQKTVTRRILPADERGIAALYFADPDSAGLNVIEMSQKGIIRVVKGMEADSFTEESQVIQGFRLGDYGEGEHFLASWSPIKLELQVAVRSEQSLQIWDLSSARRKSLVATDLSARITCMDTERSRGNLSLMGFDDGTVALYDVRQRVRHCVSRWSKGHKEDVLSCCLTVSQEIASMGKDGALNVWDLRVPHQAICSSVGLLHGPKRGIGAAAMSSTSVFAQLLQPTDGNAGTELSIRKLAFPAPVEIANISLSSIAFPESTACMVFHPRAARLAIAEKKKIVIRTAKGER